MRVTTQAAGVVGAGAPTGVPTVTYLTKRFPRLSETFILDEILGLEAAGVPLRLYALADPGETIVQPDVARVSSPVTYLHGTDRLGDARATAAAHLLLLAREPRRYLRTVFYIARKRRHLATVRHFLNAGRLAELARRDGSRHVHAAFAHGPASVAHFVHLLTGLPFSFGAHAKDLYLSPPDLLGRKVAAAEFVLVCSRAAETRLREIAGPAADKIVFAPHGVDTTRFRPATRHHSPADFAGSAEPMSVLAVGRLVPKKGYPVLLDALGRLAGRGVAVRTRVVGVGPQRRDIDSLVAEYGLAGSFELLGARTHQEIAALYPSADVFVQASVVLADGDRDGIPNSLLEAMSSGLPVVASAVSGIPEVVLDGTTGLLVPPGDPEALAGALARLAADPGLRRRLGAAARQHAVERLDRTACVRHAAVLFGVPAELASGGIPAVEGEVA